MASTALSGKPGGGKSLYATYQILEELENGTRSIVTNLDFDCDAAVKYFAKIGKPDIAVFDRVQILPYEDVKHFWRFRGPLAEVHPAISEQQVRDGARPDLEFLAKQGSVFYVLDELHEHLNSRQWKHTGPALLYYIAKHRHLGDDVLWITQSIPNVDKQWRSVTQEYLYVRNFSKERWKGFSRGKGFRLESYLEPFTGSQQVQWSKEYKLDKEKAKCYRTSTVGGKADIGAKIKGVPLWILWGGLILAFCILTAASIWGPDLFVSLVTPKEKKKPADKPNTIPTNQKVVAPLSTPDLSQTHQKEINTIAVPLKYGSGVEIIETIKTNFPQVSCALSPDSNSLLLTGSFSECSQASHYAKQLDTERANVTIRAIVFRESTGKNRQTGMLSFFDAAASGENALGGWSRSFVLELTPENIATGFFSFGSIQAGQLFLDALLSNRATDDSITVTSHPLLTVRTGEPATLKAGREVPVPVTVAQAQSTTTSVEYKQAEFSLEVTPYVLPSGAIRAKIAQGNSEVLERVQIGGNTVPVLSTQSLTTEATVKQTQILLLGGIQQDIASHGREGVPFLRDIPLIGFLVGEKKTEFRKESVWILLSFQLSDSGSGAGSQDNNSQHATE